MKSLHCSHLLTINAFAAAVTKGWDEGSSAVPSFLRHDPQGPHERAEEERTEG